MKWLSKELLLCLHDQLLEETGGSPGLRDESLLESALYAPLQSFGSDELYPTVVEKAARLAYGLSSNHAFVDGNKRISALSLLVVLQMNQIPMRRLQEGELSNMFMKLAEGGADYENLLQWVKDRLVL